MVSVGCNICVPKTQTLPHAYYFQRYFFARLLTDEVSKKCKAISVLDQEKSALIRDLFQARARLRQAELNEAEATFM